MAERPDIFEPFSLARAAAVFNDLKQFARSQSLLERALAPSRQQTVWWGLDFTWGLSATTSLVWAERPFS